MGGLRGVWFDGLTRNAGGGRMVECCWVPHSTSSGQAPSAGSGQVLRGRRDVVRLGPPKTAGRLTMNGRGWGTEGGGRRGLGCVQSVGECVQSVGPMCPVLGPMCSVFCRMCSVSGRMCSLWRGRCSVCRGWASPRFRGHRYGMEGWTESGIGCGRKAGFLGGPRSARREGGRGLGVAEKRWSGGGPVLGEDFGLFEDCLGGLFLLVGWVAVFAEGAADEAAEVGSDVFAEGPVDGDVVADGVD